LAQYLYFDWLFLSSPPTTFTMMVRWYHPWLERLCGPAGSTSQESVDEYTHEIKVVEQLAPDVESKKLESLQKIAEKIVRDFDFSDDDVRRAVGGFVDQMST
jgi:hexokinase